MTRSKLIRSLAALILVAAAAPQTAHAQDSASAQIPKAAWRRPLGQPLADPGVKRNPTDIDDGYYQGAPVGGFGSGTFSRTYRGDFARWHIKAGVHKYETVNANQFAMFQQVEGEPAGFAQVLMNGHPKDAAQLSSWNWDYPVGAGDYAALYPKSWFDYKSENFPAHVTLEQYSPVLPDNYRESSYPVAVYRWHAENPTNKTVVVSVLLSWTNMDGWFRTYTRDFKGAPSQGNYDSPKSESLAGSTMRGIVFDRTRAGASINEYDGQFAIAALDSPGVEVTYQTTFLADGDGKPVWTAFSKDGRLANSDVTWISASEKLAGAIAVRFTLKPGEKKIVPMVIAWDFPVVEFGLGRKWNRKYTDFYGASGTSAWAIARDGLLNAAAWSRAIDKWQAPYANDESLPLWYRGMMFNELYALTDGGTFWGRPVGSDKNLPASFALLECFDYAYYATLDVRFYASLPLLKFWPQIDKDVLREFADTVSREYPDMGLAVAKTAETGSPVIHKRKNKGLVPHDLGVPEGDPFFLVNEPGWQDTNQWKDLNSKFVLMAYRDYVLTGRTDTAFLKQMWPSMQDAIAYLQQFDHSGGGVPENSGFPDQTYDSWPVHGVSAYCGGLWLAALRAAEETAKALGDSSAADKYHAMFLKAQNTYVTKLWNGEYFRYDVDSPKDSNAIQADQLAGEWYANLTGLGDIVPPEMKLSAMKKVYAFNVLKFGGGEMGAANGMAADGSILTDNEQGEEVWAGTTFGFAALLLSEGMKDEAFHTAWGIYHVSYETKGYWFRTPEAWDVTGNFRASMYMRPAAVWALVMMPPKSN